MSRKKNTSADAEVHDYTDSNFDEDQDEKKSIACNIFKIEGAPISWSLRNQSIVAL